MAMDILRDRPLDWRGVAAIAEGANLAPSPRVWAAIERAAEIVEAIAKRGIRAYGVSTGVGALSETVVSRAQHAQLSRNLLTSHAAGVGEPLPEPEVRAVIAAQVNNHAHGRSGLRASTVRCLLAFLALKPVLATSWSHNDDSSVWTLKSRMSRYDRHGMPQPVSTGHA